MAAAKKKPSLGEVAVDIDVPDAPDSEASMDDDTYTSAVDEVAELLHVGENDMDAFREAFKAAVMSCPR